MSTYPHQTPTLKLLAERHPNTRTDEASWRNLGFQHMLATALAENEKTYAQVWDMPPSELVNLALEWEGIIGYSNSLTALIRQTYGDVPREYKA